MPEISLFQNVFSIENPINIDLITHLEEIRDGAYEDIVTKCRTIKDKEERDKFKEKMPTATLSGVFTARNNGSIVKHSEYIAIDLDYVENLTTVKHELEKDKYVFSVFMSVSGYGLRVLFRIDPYKHKEAFIGISAYLLENYRQSTDPNGVSLSKPYIVSFDPYLYLSPDPVSVFKRYVKETTIKAIPNFVHTNDDFSSVIKQILVRGINICEGYNDWLKVGFALAQEFGESGRGYFHDLSRMSEKYSVTATDKQYGYCLKAHGSKKVNISSIYYLAKLFGVNIISERTKTIVRTTRNGKKAGLNKDQIVINLEKFSQITDAKEIVEKVFDSSDDNFSDEDQSVLHQLEMFISNNYILKMNEVTGYIESQGKTLSPSDLNTIYVSAKKLMPSLDYQLMIRLLKSDFIESFNPFYLFFSSDGIPVELPAIPKITEQVYESPLIDKLSASIENRNPAFTNFFLRKWIVSVVSSAHKIHSPLLLALLGRQNTGKTEFFRRLFPPELAPYYAESKLDKEKDDELLMTENLIIMDDELGGKSKQESKKLNSITSKQWYSLRRPYGDHNEKILRLAVLCGTSNYNEIMSDPTGNRRIIPIEVDNIDKNLYNSINKKDMWLEAFKLYKDGFDWRVTENDIPYLNRDHVQYEIVIKERELLAKYYEPGDDLRLTATEIAVEIEFHTRQKISIVNIGKEMENLGFCRKTTREGPYSTLKKWCVARRQIQPMTGIETKDLPF